MPKKKVTPPKCKNCGIVVNNVRIAELCPNCECNYITGSYHEWMLKNNPDLRAAKEDGEKRRKRDLMIKPINKFLDVMTIIIMVGLAMIVVVTR